MELYRCSECGGLLPASAFYDDRTSHPSPVGRYCKVCNKRRAGERQAAQRKRAVEYKGGKCEICGYNKCIRALEFHHQDPTKKDPNYKSIWGWTWERIKKEVGKCRLLCANCHREVHDEE